MKKIDILNPEKIFDIVDKVNKFGDHWQHRDKFELYTLGAAAYIDAPTQETIANFGLSKPELNQYQNLVKNTNALLEANFSDLYQHLLNSLSTLLGKKVCFAEGKALPGFHIFNAHSHYAQAKSHVPHYDRQYECLDWNEAVNASNAETISFTLPLKLPKAGGGLCLWDLELNDVLGLEKTAALTYVKKARMHKETYKAGTLVCHSGHQLHRIEPWQSKGDEQRITLQGHGLLLQNCWHIYW